jgi:hypothetical protein
LTRTLRLATFEFECGLNMHWVLNHINCFVSQIRLCYGLGLGGTIDHGNIMRPLSKTPCQKVLTGGK